jgi:glycosyltransferase involved in cell wall biosynthesis
MKNISVVFVIKNAIINGYCFWESLQSVLPFADEIIISEGYSTDATYEYMEAFVKKHNNIPITLFQDEWPENSYVGEAIAIMTEKAIRRAKGEHIYLLQADEVLHESLAEHIRYNFDNGRMNIYNGISLSFYHFNRAWVPDDNAAYNDAVRLVKNNRNIALKGDGWEFGGRVDPVYFLPEWCKRIYHFNWCFPRTNDIKDIEHAKIYQNITEYQDRMKKACNNLKQEKVPYPLDSNFNDFPALSKRFLGAAEYPLPDIT